MIFRKWAKRLARWLDPEMTQPQVTWTTTEENVTASSVPTVTYAFPEVSYVSKTVSRETSQAEADLLAVTPASDMPPEYDMWITSFWGNTPLAAASTRSRVRALVRDKATYGEIRRAIEGEVIDIE